MKKLFVMILVIMLISLPLTAQAGFGDFSGDTDFGGSDFGGSFGGSDWGSDYGSSYGGSDLGCLAMGLSCAGVPWWAIVVVVVILSILGGAKKKGGKRGAAPRPQGASASDYSRLRPIAELKAIDPAFSQDRLAQKLSNLYVQMQQCWQAKDLSPIEPYFTAASYAQFDTQLDGYRRSGTTNYVERPAVLDVRLMGFAQDSENDILIARLKTRLTEYTLNDKTGELVRGNRTAEKFMDFEWTLLRTKGVTSDMAETAEMHCPSCGAPINVNQSAKCSYCGTVVERKGYDWVISSIRALSQSTGN